MSKGGVRARQVKAYRRLLLDVKRELVASRMRLESISTVEQVAEDDLAPVSHDEFVTLEVNGLDYEKLRMVEEALDRIAAGDYGVCLGCERRIPEKRLRAVPWARYCVECQERLAAESTEPGRVIFGTS
jgi:DnaK suppressor protein